MKEVGSYSSNTVLVAERKEKKRKARNEVGKGSRKSDEAEQSDN
jgi:hypothetical protein